jgi:hypothetical protein
LIFSNLLDFPQLTICGTKTAFLSLCENIAVYGILRMGYTKVRQKCLQRAISQFIHANTVRSVDIG